MKIEELIKRVEDNDTCSEMPAPVHMFKLASHCYLNEMPNRAAAHIRAAKRTILDEIVDTGSRDARKFWHQCYLVAEDFEIYIRRHLRLAER